MTSIRKKGTVPFPGPTNAVVRLCTNGDCPFPPCNPLCEGHRLERTRLYDASGAWVLRRRAARLLTGLGGGVVIVPLLVIAFGVDIHYAMRRFAGLGDRHLVGSGRRLRPRRLLEHPHRHGAGSRHHDRGHRRGVSPWCIAPGAISIIFGMALLVSALSSARPRRRRPGRSSRIGWPATCGWIRAFPRRKDRGQYHVVQVPLGFGLMWWPGCCRECWGSAPGL